jgi:hypothetical protein
MYPWIYGRCTREYTRANLVELTVYRRSDNHDDDSADGSNRELLCVYCHDNEHARYIDNASGNFAGAAPAATATGNPFAGLASLMKAKGGCDPDRGRDD